MTASFPLPENEEDRMSMLLGLNILDSLPERAYDDFTKLASAICETPIALITFLDDKRQWFKSRLGLETPQTPREHAFCSYAIMNPNEVMVVSDATQDNRFASNPLVTSEPEIRFYAGAPLVMPGGQALGTICVIDRQPRELTAVQIETLKILARGIVLQLQLRRSIAILEDTLLAKEKFVEHLRENNRIMERERSALQAQARSDPLTGANNRRAFESRLAEEFSRARRHAGNLSILMLDVDHFKQYNDSFGHPAGDEVLRTITRLLHKDMRPYDFLARYGGEEFVIILPDTSLQGALIMGERFRRTIQLSSWLHPPVTISIGAAAHHTDMGSAQALVKAADQALYLAKNGGRNRVSAEPAFKRQNSPGTR